MIHSIFRKILCKLFKIHDWITVYSLGTAMSRRCEHCHKFQYAYEFKKGEIK
jgi:hypothetical protein